MWYKSKAEILEHLGMDRKNVRGLERLVKKGYVVEKGGLYISKNDLVRMQVKKIKEELELIKVEKTDLNNRLELIKGIIEKNMKNGYINGIGWQDQRVLKEVLGINGSDNRYDVQ